MLPQAFFFQKHGSHISESLWLGGRLIKKCCLWSLYSSPSAWSQTKETGPYWITKESRQRNIQLLHGLGFFWTKHMTSITRGHNSSAVAMTWAPIEFFCISFSSLQPLLFATYLILGCVLKQAIQMSESATSNYLVYTSKLKHLLRQNLADFAVAVKWW